MIKAVIAVFILRFLVLLLRLLALVVSESANHSREENRSYECGFEHFTHSRLPFSFRYFLLTMIFLVFDIEIVFLLFLPESLLTSIAQLSLLAFSLAFLSLLAIGLFYE